MEILCFIIKGKLAHFRKYYANNTAFSFTIPPRTTLMGIIAAFMGLEKDSYYEQLSSDNIHFGIRVLNPLKKSFQRLNFLSVKRLGDIAKNLDSDFRGRGGRIQTPFEIVSGLDLRKDEVQYQIFIKPTTIGLNLFNTIKLHFLTDKPVFNISLGTANFSASISDIRIITDKNITECSHSDFININTAIPSEKVVELNFDKESTNYNFIEEELFPSEFISNKNRELKKMNRLLFSVTNLPVRVKLSAKYYNVKTTTEELNIVFVDE